MAVVAVVKYNGSPDALVWRYPSQGLGTWTKLIVYEQHEGILYFNGQVYDIFPPGEHQLSPGNIPLLNEVLNLPDGEQNPLAIDILYVNKERNLEVKWGTPAPIELLDPKYKALVPLKALGQFNVQIGASSIFINNIAETLPVLDNDNLIKYLRNLHLNTLKDNILLYFQEKDVSILEINSHLEALTGYLANKALPIINGLGIKLNTFHINQVKLSEDSPVVKQINEAMARKAVAELVGSEFAQAPPPVINANSAVDAKTNQPETTSTGVQEQENSNMLSGMSDQTTEIGVIDLAIPNTCPVCYFDLDPITKTCPECGYGKDETDSNVSMGEIEEFGTETERESERETKRAAVQHLTKKCPNCNSDMGEVARFCSVCGNDTTAIDAEPSKADAVDIKPQTLNRGNRENEQIRDGLTVRTCPSCKTQLRGSQKFCHKCGYKS